MTKKLTKVAMTTALAAAAIVPAVVATPAQAAEAEVTFAKAYYTTANGTAAFAAGNLAGVISATGDTGITHLEASNGEVFTMQAFSAYLAVNSTATTDQVLTALSKAGKALSADQVKALNVKEGKVENNKVTVDADAPVADVKVESVKAINAKQLVINFSTPVKKADVVAAASVSGETKDTLVNGKITVTSLDSANVTINNAKASLSEDGKTLTLTATASEVFKGRYDVKIAAGAIQSTDNKGIEKFETTIKAEDTTAPTVKETEKVTATKYKVTFSEPIKSLGTVSFKVGNKDIQTSSTGVTVNFTAGNNHAEFTLGSDVEAGQEVVAKFVGTLDYADQVISPNPTTVSFVKGAKDGVAPTVTSITVISGKTFEVKFSEELAAVPTITVGGTAATVKQDKTDKTKYIGTLATAKSGLQTVEVVAGFTDLSGEVQTNAFSKAENFSIDTTAPKLVSTTVETGTDNKQYLVLTFDENVEKGSVSSITVTGKKTKNYVTSNLASVTINDLTKLQFSEDNKKVAKIALADVLGANDEKGSVFEVTVTGNAALVQDESGNAGITEAKATFTRGEDGSVATKTQATIDKTHGLNGIVAVDNNTLTVKFDQAVDGASATTVANYVVEGATVEKAELDSAEQTVTLTLKAGTVQDTGAHKVTISNVKAKNGTAMDVYTTSESINENVLPTLESAKVTAVTQTSQAITASTAGFYKADGTAYTPVAGDAIGLVAKYYEAGDSLENSGTAASAGWYKLADDSAYNPQANDEIAGKGAKYYAQGAEIVPATNGSTTILFTFSENVKTAGADATYSVKSGTTAIGTGTITNDTTADTKTLSVTVDEAVTAEQVSTGLTLTKLSGDVVDSVENKFVVPASGILVK